MDFQKSIIIYVSLLWKGNKKNHIYINQHFITQKLKERFWLVGYSVFSVMSYHGQKSIL